MLHMSMYNLLDMDYFLNKDVFGEDSFDEEGFYIFLIRILPLEFYTLSIFSMFPFIFWSNFL